MGSTILGRTKQRTNADNLLSVQRVTETAPAEPVRYVPAVNVSIRVIDGPVGHGHITISDT